MTDKFKINIDLKCPEGIDPDAEIRGTIEINEKVIENFTIKQGTSQSYEHEIDIEEGEHVLTINNHYSADPKTACVIEKVTFDDIDLGIIAYSGEYRPDYPEPWYTDECAAGRTPKEVWGGKDSQDGSTPMFMGWEGSYKLKFYTPLYEWLLEHL